VGIIIRSAVITVKGLVRLMVGELSHEEDSLLDKALLETYAKMILRLDQIYHRLILLFV